MESQRIFRRLTTVYNRQLREIKLRSEESYAREQWLSTTIRSIGDAVIACDTDGTVSFMNFVAEQLTGWNEDEAKGKTLHEVFPIFNEETRAVVENPVDSVRRLGTVVGLATTLSSCRPRRAPRSASTTVAPPFATPPAK